MMRRFAIAASLLLLATGAQAQQRYSIVVSTDELNLIGKALGKQPFEDVQVLVGNIAGQIAAQNKQAADAAAKSAKDALDKAVAEKLKADAEQQPAE